MTNDKNERRKLVEAMIAMQGDIESIEKELKEFPWDWLEKPLCILPLDCIRVRVREYLDGAISWELLAKWAEALEQREDVENETDDVAEWLFMFAGWYEDEKMFKEYLMKKIHKENLFSEES